MYMIKIRLTLLLGNPYRNNINQNKVKYILFSINFFCMCYYMIKVYYKRKGVYLSRIAGCVHGVDVTT